MSKIIDTEWGHKLGEQIKRAREDANLTQDELAGFLKLTRQTLIKYEKTGWPLLETFAQMAAELETRFRIRDLIITVERTSPRLKTVPKQLRLDFEKSQTYPQAVITITPKEGQILINARIPA